MYTQQPQFHRKKLARAVRSVLLGSGVALAVSAGPLYAGETNPGTEIDALKGQLQTLMQRIEELERNQSKVQEVQQDQEEAITKVQEETITAPANVVTAGSTLPGSFKIPGTNTEVSVSGYVKADLIYDEDTDVGDSFTGSSIPLDGTAGADSGGHVRLHAKQSRFRIKSNTDAGNGRSVATTIEGDFLGQGGNESFSNSTTFRLRHANISYDTGHGTLMVGQGWTNFMDFVAYPSTVDFFGPAGKSFKRQGQVRWTTPGGFSISLENPETDGLGAAGRLGESRGGIGSDEAPDIIAAWRGGPGGGGGSYEFAALWRQLGIDGVVDDVAFDDDTTGWGINLAGGWDLSSSVHGAASVTFGDGIGSYIINGFANDVYVAADGSVDSVESMSASANLKFDTSSTSSILLAYGFFENDDPTQSNGIDTLQTIHLGYQWKPVPDLNFGIEIINGDLETVDGEGDATRLQFGVQKSF